MAEFTNGNQTMPFESALEAIVDDAPDYSDGAIESLQRKVTKQSELLGKLAAIVLKTEQEQLDFLTKNSWRGWTKAK